MNKKIIAWDLGTGGNKASLYDTDGTCIEALFIPYNTTYPAHAWHEQRPEDWWKAVVDSTKLLIDKTGVNVNEITCCGISGHSLGAVPIDKNGNLLRESTPIWSDGRATKQVRDVFANYDEEKWYMTTGNGFTPMFYSAFKILWYRDNEPDVYNNIHKVIGTKDYINFKLTGRLCTDPSYASGSGVWDLTQWEYSPELISAMNLRPEIFPEVVASTEVIGKISRRAAQEIGLSADVDVVAGGVDNSCMALGAKAFKEGRIYNSLGSSSWIAVSSHKPVLEKNSRPYVFTHVVPGMFASALCVASGGSSFRWFRDQLGKEFIAEAAQSGEDEYNLMGIEAQKSPVGAHKLLFNPSLGGGMPMDKSYNLRGAYLGLDLLHTKADIIRATMEGISMSLRACLEKLRGSATINDEILLVGGGSKNPLWRQIYADVYNITVLKSNIDQQAAALGAAACAAVGTGIWKDFDVIDSLHTIEETVYPIKENVEIYNQLMKVYSRATDDLSDIGDMLSAIKA